MRVYSALQRRFNNKNTAPGICDFCQCEQCKHDVTVYCVTGITQESSLTRTNGCRVPSPSSSVLLQ
ncbi:hypothetical protein Q7C36_014008 [Tachysurus vachellii]|uniref:Uncharacterized protein n=1 Tax=Tachysurus vachellii TaxID=175792 RepID=A0AA88MGZ3_TACVA|nr:hypothetical protein Q7C36_014008 [Tachysurus vachellii]